MNRFPPVRSRLLFVHLLLSAFLCGFSGIAVWRLVAFPPDPVGAAGLFAVVTGWMVIPALLYRIVFLLTASYDLADAGSLHIRFGSWQDIIPVDQIEEIRSGGKIPAFLRKRAPGWLEMWRGHVAAEEEEGIDWMATDRGQRLLLLITKRRRLAVSPADPSGFVRCLTDLSARGSLEKIEPIFQHPPLILADIIKHPPGLGLLLGGLAGMVSLGAFLVGIQSGLPVDQPFRFDPAGSPTSLGDPIRLVILPLAGGFVWLLNAIIGWWAWRKGLRPTAYTFWTVSLLVAVGLWASSASLILAK